MTTLCHYLVNHDHIQLLRTIQTLSSSKDIGNQYL